MERIYAEVAEHYIADYHALRSELGSEYRGYISHILSNAFCTFDYAKLCIDRGWKFIIMSENPNNKKLSFMTLTIKDIEKYEY